MARLSAREARQLTEQSVTGPAIEQYVESLDKKILAVASEGKSGFDPWLHIGTLRGMSPSHEQREAIRKHYESAGYSWKDHPNPDPGHPASRDYTILSWS